MASKSCPSPLSSWPAAFEKGALRAFEELDAQPFGGDSRDDVTFQLVEIWDLTDGFLKLLADGRADNSFAALSAVRDRV